MENSSYVALSRQAALWRQLDVVANNMANANTTGYKGENMMFSEYLMPTKADNKAYAGKISFVQDRGLMRDTTPGPLTKTDNALDVAIEGDGYFVVDTPEGQRFTRSGHFRLDEAGMMVTPDGSAVMQTGDQPIIFAPNESRIAIAGDGTVSTENGVIGRLRVVRFENEQELRKAGQGVYETTADPQEVERPRLSQGMLEESNVQPIIEMTKMIDITRQYQGVQKMIDNEHERQLKAIQALGQRSA